MVDSEIIRPSTSPWNSRVILIKKKDNSTRFVCDFRALKDVTKKDSYPLPHIRDVIDKIEGDAASEEYKEKMAFSVPRGKSEFNVTPYGLYNAGASYQRMIDICLAGSPADRVLVYMDNIVIFSSTFAEHISSLKSVFQHLRSAGVTLKSSKCIFGNKKVDFLNYESSAEGIKPQKHFNRSNSHFSVP